MTAPLHLLRGFVQWNDRRTGKDIKTVDDADAWVRHIADMGFDHFYTWTTRRPARAAELEGGSVYFVKGGFTLFRMPFVEICDDDDGYSISMRPELFRVERHRVGFLRGWRYLEDRSAPADLPERPAPGEMPEEMASELKELGLA